MSIQKGRTPMKKVLLTLATLTLSVLIGGNLTIYASDIESENSVLSTYRNEIGKICSNKFLQKNGDGYYFL